MSRTSLRAVSESLRTDRDRFVDLRIDLAVQDERGKLHPDAEVLLTVGGKWDRSTKRYIDDAQRARILGLHKGQVEAARWVGRWFEAKARKEILQENGKPVYSLLLHGGRRAGKTDLGAKSGIAYAVFRPKSFVWLISENQPKTEELEHDVRGWIPSDWYDWRGAPWHQFMLPNGSVIWLRSAHDPQALKRGRCDYAVLNEAQNISEDAFAIVRAATADNGGLTVLAANPPDAPAGFWVERFMEESRAGKRQAREFQLDATKNPHIDHASLLALKDELDDRTYRREILGEFLPREDVVFHAWSPSSYGNIRPVPELPNADVTRSFLKRMLGREYEHCLGVDLQLYPFPCAVEVRAYLDPDNPNGDPLLFYTNTVAPEGGDEEALSSALLDKGYDPDKTVLIVDASGSWQGIRRERKIPSFDLLRNLGWRHIFKPDDDMEKNPDILERVRCANSLMKSANGKRRVFSSPDLLDLNNALKLWENRNGVPYRKSEHAHFCDAATYPLWRFYPRRVKRKAAKPGEGMSFMNTRPKGPRSL
jgi:hypothetical protein